MLKTIAPSLRGARSCSQSIARTKKSGGKAAFTFSNALRTRRFTYSSIAKSIAPLLRGAKKRKKSLSFLHGPNKTSEPTRKNKRKKSVDVFLAFQLKPRLVSNSIYEKEIH
jgi:hypothetical protein